MRLHADQDQVGLAGIGRVFDGADLRHVDLAQQRGLDVDAAAAQRFELSAAGDERDVLAPAHEEAAEERTDGAGAKDDELHGVVIASGSRSMGAITSRDYFRAPAAQPASVAAPERTSPARC